MKEKINIRKAQKKDIPSIRTIVRKSFKFQAESYLLEEKYGIILGKRWDQWMIEDVLKSFHPDLDNLLVGTLDEKTVGFLSFSINDTSKMGAISYMAVHPEARGRGIAKKLVSKALKTFKEKGALFASVTTAMDERHTAARRAYERAGFEPFNNFIKYVKILP